MPVVQDPKFYQELEEIEANFIKGQQIADHLTAIFPVELYLDKIIWVADSRPSSRMIPPKDSRQDYAEFMEWSESVRFQPEKINNLCIGFWDEMHNLYLNLNNHRNKKWLLIFSVDLYIEKIEVNTSTTLDELLENSIFSQYLSHQILEVK